MTGHWSQDGKQGEDIHRVGRKENMVDQWMEVQVGSNKSWVWDTRGSNGEGQEEMVGKKEGSK